MTDISSLTLEQARIRLTQVRSAGRKLAWTIWTLLLILSGLKESEWIKFYLTNIGHADTSMPQMTLKTIFAVIGVLGILGLPIVLKEDKLFASLESELICHFESEKVTKDLTTRLSNEFAKASGVKKTKLRLMLELATSKSNPTTFAVTWQHKWIYFKLLLRSLLND